MIPVTRPFLPPQDEYFRLINGIWNRGILTNNGPLVRQLEQELCNYLKVPCTLFVTNGTIALQIAIKALKLSGEIITTPFSYVATTSSIVWEGLVPVFVDIDQETLNIDAKLIENAITDKTTGILATHVFGNPCDILAIQQIAEKYNLKVIYDAAHCFGSRYRDKSIFCYGDITTTSFHATKLFHTIEGGAIFSNNDEIIKSVNYLRNFGHDGYEKFKGLGINGKNSEFHAAMGLLNLAYIDEILQMRKNQIDIYNSLLKPERLRFLKIMDDTLWNHSYFPVIFESESLAMKVKLELESRQIYPRRYFYPSLDTLDYVKNSLVSVSQDVSKRILCLPLYFELLSTEIDMICEVINTVAND